MNCLYRAIKSVVYRKMNSLLLMFIYTIISTIILAGLCTYFGARQFAQEAKAEITATVLIKNNAKTVGTLFGNNTIPNEVAEDMSKLSQVKAGNYTVGVTGLALPKGFSAINSSVQTQEFSDWAQLSVYGNTYSDQNSSFVNGEITLNYGRHLTAQDTNQCIVSYNIFQAEGWTLGDEIEVVGFIPSNNGISYTEPITLEIVGFYTFSQLSDPNNSPEYNYENRVYVTPKTAMEINGLNNIATVSYTISDPTHCNEFIADCNDLLSTSGVDNSGYEFFTDNSQYLRVQTSTESVVSISKALVVLSILMGIIILSLIIISGMNEREFEIGILLSVGESKIRIALQLIFENVFVILIAISLSLAFGNIIKEQVSRVISSYEIVVTLSPQVVFLIYALGITISLIVSAGAVMRIAAYNPKKILMNME